MKIIAADKRKQGNNSMCKITAIIFSAWHQFGDQIIFQKHFWRENNENQFVSISSLFP